MEKIAQQRGEIGIRLELTVFFCGAIVMIFEINGSRVLSPFLGTSTYIWTSLIGIILASLALGYWLGGRVADARPSIGVLSGVVFSSAGLVSLTILIKDVYLGIVGSIPTGLEFKAIAASVVLFAPASVAFGFVLPFAVKLRTSSLSVSGQTAGRLYALSTVGSILGTFCAGFLLIPFLGSARTLYLIAGTLFLNAILLSPLVWSRARIGCIVLFLAAVSSNEGIGYLRQSANNLIDIDTEYTRLLIFETVEPVSGRRLRVLANDPYFVQSAMFLDGDDLVLGYNRFFNLAKALAPEAERSLMIGGAAYSFPRDQLRSDPDVFLDVVEIDPKMTEIARRHFRLVDDPRMRIVHQDARTFIRTSDHNLYDIVFMDAFGTLFSVPYHLTTFESMLALKKLMKADGVLLMNLGGSISGDGSRFFRAELATLHSLFSSVRVFKVDLDQGDEDLQNLVLVATDRDRGPTTSLYALPTATLLRHEVQIDQDLGVPILTDDHAPVEYYNSFAHDRIRRR